MREREDNIYEKVKRRKRRERYERKQGMSKGIITHTHTV